MGRGLIRTTTLNPEYDKQIRHVFGTYKHAYLQLKVMNTGMSYGAFRLALIGEPTTPARAKIIADVWNKYLQLPPNERLAAPEARPRKKRSVKRAPKIDRYIKDVNTNKPFKFREDQSEEGK